MEEVKGGALDRKSLVESRSNKYVIQMPDVCEGLGRRGLSGLSSCCDACSSEFEPQAVYASPLNKRPAHRRAQSSDKCIDPGW